MNANYLLCGVGGQGTVLASRIIARTAIDSGLSARTAETIGMAQRGGCVVSHVRVGDHLSPLIPHGEADALIAFEPGEAVRCLSYLKENGCAIVNARAVRPVTASLSGARYQAEDMLAYLKSHVARLIVVDGDAIPPRALNVALLGAAAASGALGFTPEQIAATLEKSLKPQYLEMNRQAFKLGAEYAR